MSYTIQQVARRAGVQLNALSEAECSDEDLLTFASHLGESWNLIGQSLKLTKEQLSAIEGTIAEKRLAVLQQWKESTLDATYQVLAEAFLTCMMPRSALKLCEHFKESHPTAVLIPAEPRTLQEVCEDGKENCKTKTACKPSAENLSISGMSPEALAEWLGKEIGESYQADINKLKEKFVGGALFLSLCPPCGELLKNLDLTPEGETLLLKTAKELRLVGHGDQNKHAKTEDSQKELNKSGSKSSLDHNQLTVHCPHQDMGCQWQGKFEKLQEHLSPDPDNELPSQGCGYELVSCSRQCGTKIFRRQIQEHETECCPKLPMEIQVSSMMKKLDAICRELSETKHNYETVKQELSVMKTEHDLLKKRFPIAPLQYTMYNVQAHISSENRWMGKPFYSHFGGFKMKFDVVLTQPSKVPGSPVIIKYFVFVAQGEFDSQLKWPFSCEVVVEIYNHSKSEWDNARKIQVSADRTAAVGSQSEVFTSQKKSYEREYDYFQCLLHYLKENTFCFRIASVNVN